MLKFHNKSYTENINDNLPNMDYNQVLYHMNYTNVL